MTRGTLLTKSVLQSIHLTLHNGTNPRLKYCSTSSRQLRIRILVHHRQLPFLGFFRPISEYEKILITY